MKIKKCIILNGVPCSGKDTMYKQMIALITEKGYFDTYVDKSSSVKAFAEYIHRADRDLPKDENLRSVMSDMKRAAIKLDLPFKTFIKEWDWFCGFIDNSDCYESGIYFFDVREISEIEKIKKALADDCIVVWVNNNYSEKKFGMKREVSEGDAECLKAYTYDFTIDNNGSLQDLRDECQRLLEFVS